MKTIFDSVLIGMLGLGSGEMLTILLIVLIGIPVLSYRLGWKSGYNKGKLDALENKNRTDQMK